ncbi:MAG: hypothetical protein KDB27_01835 [Planctomycetales bacterium]|nr:hypothetical protein [Planctomycetales bacterium]
MATITTLEYALLSENVKKMNPVGRFRPDEFKYSTGFINNGFWGCIYVDDAAKQAVVAFKGTGNAKVDDDDVGSSRPNSTIIGDITADLKLAIGIIPNQASTARKLFKRAKAAYDNYELSVVGHSLGGYLAQVVSYWYKAPCVTFNAPGAWGDLQKAKLNLFKPQVAWRSIKSTFSSDEVCNNFIHIGDPIGNYGLHRGRTNRLAGMGHGIKGIRKTIEGTRWRDICPFTVRDGAKGMWDRV